MNQIEHQEQVAFFDYVRYKANTDDRYKMIYAIPNGSARNIITATNLKREGVKAGVPDISVDVACGDYHGLKIEMKVRKIIQLKTKSTVRLSKLTDKQQEFKELLERQGYKVVVCYSSQEAIDELERYLCLK